VPAHRFVAPQYMPAGAQELVADVRVAGNRAVSEARVRSYLKTRVDRAFDPTVVEQDVRALIASGLFRDVRTYQQRVAGGVVVTFEVFERPTIGYIRFVGNEEMLDKTLLKQVGIKEGDALNQYTVEEARRKLEDFYRTRGYQQIRVSVLEGTEPRDAGIVFLVNEGNKERVLYTRFVGNTIATDARLRTQIQTKPGVAWIFKGELDRAKLDEDVNRITSYYRGLGFFRARVGRELEFDAGGNWATVTFVIDEGPRYVVNSVAFVGNEKFSKEELAADLALKPGDYFDLGAMGKDVGALKKHYGARGHVFADVKADPRFLEEPGRLDLVYDISEGEIYRVGKINVNIAGDTPHTRTSVALNRISLRPGDIIDIREVRASERRLKSSQLFLNEPQRNVAPKIVIRPPELNDSAAAVASEKRDPPPSNYRGQSPDGGSPAAGPYPVMPPPYPYYPPPSRP
jgi:outer membrane protein insertion porin family